MKYYTCARTSGGFADFTDDNIFDIGRKITITGRNVCETDRILSLVCEKVRGECEELLTPGYGDLKCGVIFRDKNTAVLSDFSDKASTFVYECFAQAKKIHDEWEKIYIQRTDYSMLDSFSSKICDGILNGRKSLCGSGKRYKRFFGTLTSDGAVNYIDELTDDIQKRYFIKGRPGTGKSTFLKRLSARGRDAGFDIEEYYCSFDSHSLDMVVSRELSVCVFDSTSPHEKFPVRMTDEILDFYEASKLSGTDEDLKDELLLVKEKYDDEMKKGKSILAEFLYSEREMAEKAKADDSELEETANKIIKTLT